MKRPARIIGILVLTVIMLSTVKIYIANSVATSGIMLGKMEEEIGSLKLQNSIISEKLYSQSSLTQVYSKAQELGYTDKKSDYVISSQQSVALKQ